MYNGADNLRIGSGFGESHMHPVVWVLMLIAMALILILPRKYVIVPILLAVFLTPFGQQIYVAGAHVFVPRVLILCGWIRVVWKNRSSLRAARASFTGVDRVFFCWALFRAIATFLEFREWQAVISECGFLVDSIGGFFLLRILIRDREDVVRVFKIFALIVCVLAVTMTYERVHNQNVFGFIGGHLVPQLRDGAIRSQGSFQGPIPAGTFGATLLCLFLWLWRSGKSTLGLAGLVGAMVMVITSASSTPLMGVAAGLLAFSMWPLRKQMRMIRWGIVVVLIALHLTMKAPVWMLINHVNMVGGNSSYHRAMLVDQFIRHFGDWWLIGVQSTAEWGWDMWDQANQFVWEGESGGLVTFICFVLIVSRSFGRLGSARKRAGGDRSREWLLWLLGCTLFAYVVAFFGISLSDQLAWGWYGLLAMIGAATSSDMLRKADSPVHRTSPLDQPQTAWTVPSIQTHTVESSQESSAAA